MYVILMEFVYPVFIRMPGEVAVVYSVLCYIQVMSFERYLKRLLCSAVIIQDAYNNTGRDRPPTSIVWLPLEFIHLVFTLTPGGNYRPRLVFVSL